MTPLGHMKTSMIVSYRKCYSMPQIIIKRKLLPELPYNNTVANRFNYSMYVNSHFLKQVKQYYGRYNNLLYTLIEF